MTLFLVPFQLLPVIMSFSHLLISAHSKSLNLKEKVKGQFNIPGQESGPFKQVG